MNKYESMFILKPDLSEEQKKVLFQQIADIIKKNNGEILKADIWSERRKFYFTINKHREGIYYLVSFNIAAAMIDHLHHAYKLNENILRVLISRL